MLRAENFSDITFVLEDSNTNKLHKFALHRCILTVRSEYFKDLLQNRWKERSEIRNSMVYFLIKIT